MRPHFDGAVPQNSAECGISHRGNSVHGAHTFVFHAPEGRASYTVGVLHAPKARFACGAKLRLRRTVPRETVFSAEKRLWKNVFEKKTKKACIPE